MFCCPVSFHNGAAAVAAASAASWSRTVLATCMSGHVLLTEACYLQLLFCTLLYCAAEGRGEDSPVRVAIPTGVNRKTFSDSPSGLLSPGDNSTDYDPDR